MSKYDPPWKRYAIRSKGSDREESWWTDDDTGCDDACDFTSWGEESLVTYVTKEEAVDQAEHLRAYYQNRGVRVPIDVRPILEHADGTFEEPSPRRKSANDNQRKTFKPRRWPVARLQA